MTTIKGGFSTKNKKEMYKKLVKSKAKIVLPFSHNTVLKTKDPELKKINFVDKDDKKISVI